MSIDTIIKGCSKWIPDIEEGCVIDRDGTELTVYYMCDRYWIHVLSDPYGMEIEIHDYLNDVKLSQEGLSQSDFLMSKELEYMENNIPPGDFYYDE